MPKDSEARPMLYTFYSYKGGVGRSMALANVAESLRRDGINVLMVDWDLEAPGLERYFPISHDSVLQHRGLIDLLEDYKQMLSQPFAEGSKVLPEIEDFLMDIYPGEGGKGSLRLLPAGKRAGEYLREFARMVTGFDYSDFYQNWEGERFFNWLRRELGVRADVVLIDSRTGVTEMSGVCTYQMADVVILFCSTNQQNLNGTLEMAQNFKRPEIEKLRHDRPLDLLIVPSRVEDRAEVRDFNWFKSSFQDLFSEFAPAAWQSAQKKFWQLKIPYIAAYSFNERVATREAGGVEHEDLTRAFDSLVREMAILAPAQSNIHRVVIRNKRSSYDAFFSYAQADKEAVEALAKKLRSETQINFFMGALDVVAGETSQEELQIGLSKSLSCVVCVGPNGAAPWQSEEIKTALAQRAGNGGLLIIPALLPGAKESEMPSLLASRSGVDFRNGLDNAEAFNSLVKAIRSVAGQVKPSTIVTDACPYRGLAPFYEEQAAVFTGRQHLIRELVDDLRTTNLLAVVGRSGSGKTSLINAGLIPALRAGGLPGSETWPVVSFRLGNNILKAAQSSLRELLGSEELEGDNSSDREENFGETNRPLRDLVKLAVKKLPPPARLVMVIDQFEELYSPNIDTKTRRRFLSELLDALSSKRLIVILALRAESYSRMLEYEPFAEAIKDNVANLLPMSREAMTEVVTEPARRQGVEFEPGLVDRILTDVGEEEGKLPLLQFALTELWNQSQDKKLTHDAYNRIGGVHGAIARWAEAEYNKLSASDQRTARKILVQLVQVGEGSELTKRRAELSEIGAAVGPERAVAKALADVRLVVTGLDKEAGTETIELAHGAIVRRWDRLRTWFASDREFFEWRRGLNRTMSEWQRTQQDEGALLSGALLETASKWMSERSNDLTDAESNYIKKSLEAERTRQRRKKLVLTAMPVLFVVALAAAMLAFALWRAALSQARSSLAGRLGAQALVQLNSQPDLALLLSLQACQDVKDLDEQNSVIARGSLLAGLEYDPSLITFLRAHKGAVNKVAFSPDGKVLASCGDDGLISLRDTETDQKLGENKSDKKVVSLAFSPDGKSLASANEDGTISLFKIADGLTPIQQRSTGSMVSVNDLAFSPDGKILASGSDDGTVMLWDADLNPPRVLRGASVSGIMSVAFSPDGKTLASGNNDGAVVLWDAASGKQVTTLSDGNASRVSGLAFFDTDTLVLGKEDGTIFLWEGKRKQATRGAISPFPARGFVFAFSPEGKISAASGVFPTIQLFDPHNGSRLGELPSSPRGSTTTIAFSRNGKTLASGSADGIITLWDLTLSHQLGELLTGPAESATCLAFSHDGKALASGSASDNITLWKDDPAGQKREQFAPHPDSKPFKVNSLAFSLDNKTLASANDDGSITLWNVESGIPKKPLKGATTNVYSVAFSPDGKMLASGNAPTEGGSSITLWNVADDSSKPLNGGDASGKIPVYSLAFSPDGKTLVSCNRDGAIVLWDVPSGKSRGLVTNEIQVEAPISVAFSPDGKTVASGHRDGKVILWDVTGDLKSSQVLTAHSAPIYGLAFSSDGRTLASGDSSKNLILWSIETHQQFGTSLQRQPSFVGGALPESDGVASASGGNASAGNAQNARAQINVTQSQASTRNSVAFSPDGKKLASTDAGNAVILWDVDLESWKKRACRIANRNLSKEEWTRFLGDERAYKLTCPDLPPGEGIK